MTAIVTGASNGIGAEIARRFAMNGYRVVATFYKDSAGAEEVAAEIRQCKQEAGIFRYNAASSEEAKALVDFTLKRYGRIDVLVNNAGIGFYGLLTDTSDEDWYRVTDINLSGAVFLTREAVKHMILNKSGSIVNIASVYGVNGASMETVYSASKAGLIGFSKALAKELAPSNITVNCIAPGIIDTRMNSRLNDEEKEELRKQIPLGRFGTVSDIADAAYFLAEQRYITGQVLGVDGGYI